MFVPNNMNVSPQHVRPEAGPAQVRAASQIAEGVAKAPASGILQNVPRSSLVDNRMGGSVNVLA
ncbi:MAG: hypothetical protein A2014_08070 [Spirochaetes bacterium GWF1_49_6]|nr:MAG: hypothetical protein A2014_08070 [Spirochaetes bacterium GWF1_49_6]